MSTPTETRRGLHYPRKPYQLDCSHEITLEIAPRVADILHCPRCDAYVTYRADSPEAKRRRYRDE